MRCFGLTPDQVLARTPAGHLRPGLSLPAAVGYGALAFGIVSVLAYSLWAFRIISHEATLYAAIACVYLGGTGLVLSRLVLGAGAAGRFALLFAAAFLLYAVAWCAFWFGLRGRHLADLWGALAGLALMTWLLRRAFGSGAGFLALFVPLFLLHSLGYYLGDVLHAAVRGSTGRLLWGAAHGVGFGAGLGYVLHRLQAPVRARTTSEQRSR